MKQAIIEKITNVLLLFIWKLNKYKDRCLAANLHRLADSYDPKPSGMWEKE